jgi:uncharacterized protein (DUF302 family)
VWNLSPGIASPGENTSEEKHPMVYEQHSHKNTGEIDTALREAAARHKFGVLSVINLKEKMKEKGIDYAGECSVYEVCNPHQAKRALEANGAVSTALPCRISVYGTPGDYRIATILPTAMMQAFGTAGVDDVAREVETDIVAMIQESA